MMTDRMQEVEVSQPGPTFPREIVDGVHWLGGCLVPEVGGHKFHNHISAYLIKGDEKTLFFDTGHPAHWQAVERDLDVALGGRPLDYIVPSHSEMPHSGNLPRLLDKYPTSLVHGEVRDYHLYYPGCEDRLVPGRPGDELDLGGRRFRLLRAIMAARYEAPVPGAGAPPRCAWQAAEANRQPARSPHPWWPWSSIWPTAGLSSAVSYTHLTMPTIYSV